MRGLPETLSFGLALFVLAGMWRESAARADVIAAYLEGYGGLSSPQANSANTPTAGTASAIGVQAGARLLIFEAYGDHTVFAADSSVSRGILGLRGAIDLGGFRLVLRAGGGVLYERGGALLGETNGVWARTGVVGRLGVALERRLDATMLGGLGIESEAFNLTNTRDGDNLASVLNDRVTGGDVFFSLHLKFEVGI